MHIICSTGANQVGFFEVLCKPLFETFCTIYPACAPLRDQLCENLEFWSENQGNPERPSNRSVSLSNAPSSKNDANLRIASFLRRYTLSRPC